MAKIFDSYDKDKTGFIEESELEAVLLDMLKAKVLAQKQRNEKVLNGDEANQVAVREIVKNGKDPLVAAKELNAKNPRYEQLTDAEKERTDADTANQLTDFVKQ